MREHFVPFLKEGDELDVIMCVPKGWSPLEERGFIVPGSQTGHCDPMWLRDPLGDSMGEVEGIRPSLQVPRKGASTPMVVERVVKKVEELLNER